MLLNVLLHPYGKFIYRVGLLEYTNYCTINKKYYCYLPVAFVSHIAAMPSHAIIQAIPESETLATRWTSEEFVSSVFSEVCVQISFGLVNFSTLLTCVLSREAIGSKRVLKKNILTLHCHSCESSQYGSS